MDTTANPNPADQLLTAASERERECALEAKALGLERRFLRQTNWITILLPAVLSILAGASILNVVIPHFETAAGLMALASGILVAIHKGLGCDAHQAECDRLVRAFDGLSSRYRSLQTEDAQTLRESFTKLEERLAETREQARTKAKDVYKRRAKEKLASERP